MQQSTTVRLGMSRFVTALLALSCLLAFPLAPQPSTVAAQTSVNIYLPLAAKADPYANWLDLGRPADGAAVNFLYVSQNCDNDRPATILAGTDLGLYRLNGSSWAINTSLSGGISVSHLISTAASGMFLSSYNQGLWRSADNGATWVRETLPKADNRIYWLAATSDYIFAAGSQGSYRRASAGGAWTAIRNTATYSIAALGGKVYAAEIGQSKDTLFISTDNGATWPTARQLPSEINFVQTLDAAAAGAQLLIGTVGGGLFALDGADNIVAFSQGVSDRVYGIWRDDQGRVYAALEVGGLKRFAQAGGSGEDLSAFPGGSLTSETLYTVSGSTACNILGVASESGKVWLRRVP